MLVSEKASPRSFVSQPLIPEVDLPGGGSPRGAAARGESARRRLGFKKGCSWSVETLGPGRGRGTTKVPVKDPPLPQRGTGNCGRLQPVKKSQWVAVTTVYLLAFPASMLVSDERSGYLLPLLLPSVLFFAGSESLSQRQVLLLLWADTRGARR